MDFDKIYSQILSQLSLGERALHKLSREEIDELTNAFNQLLSSQDDERLTKILCIIEHSASSHKEFEPYIMQYLNRNLPDHLKVFVLNCARKHIIMERFKKGQRLNFEFLETLKQHLYSPSPEVVEWTLRTIEECGSQGIYFLKDFDKIKPPPWKWFNQHQRAVREIIALLERRWRRFEKPQS